MSATVRRWGDIDKPVEHLKMFYASRQFQDDEPECIWIEPIGVITGERQVGRKQDFRFDPYTMPVYRQHYEPIGDEL